MTLYLKPRPVVTDDRADAARAVRDIEARIRAAGQGVLDLIGGPVEPGAHYPEGEVWDAETHAQFFYHTHGEGGRLAGEHGHFHLFLGAGGVPAGVGPLLWPEMALAAAPVPDDPIPLVHRSARDRGVFGHLVALSLDATGRPIGLFTTNRWVTGETWYRGDDVARMLNCFRFAAEPSLLAAWLAAVLRLLEPRVRGLIAERDRVVMDWRRRRSRKTHVFEDRRLDLISAVPVDFEAELAAMQA